MPRIALFYDWLNQWGGAERVLLNLIKLYPRAPLFTLVHQPSTTSWIPKTTKIIPSNLNKLPLSASNPIFYTILYDFFLEQFNFTNFDIIISTTSTLGHCLLTPPPSLFVTYFHNINRHLYSRPYLKFYQNIDKIYIHRPDAYFCNSQTVANRLNQIYHIKPQVINPGINTKFFKLPSKKKLSKNFLVVSRLVPHKRINLAIKACGELGLSLIIVGAGREYSNLLQLSSKYKNITFLGNVSDTKLRQLYQQSQALIYPQEEDFGLSALEAQACGCPVIAFNKGGATETVIDQKTGIFFSEPTVTSLKAAITKFFHTTISPLDCNKQANNFSETNFMLNFDKQIQLLWHKHQTTLL